MKKSYVISINLKVYVDANDEDECDDILSEIDNGSLSAMIYNHHGSVNIELEGDYKNE